MTTVAERSPWRAAVRWYAPLAIILVLAAALRVLALGKPLYIDEIVSVTVAEQPLDRMARAMRLIDASPALPPLILHAWLRVHDSDVWARLLMAVFGILTVPAATAVARRAFDRTTALWAAALIALSPPLVHYSQYIRNYSLFTLLAAIHLWLTLSFVFDAGTHDAAGSSTGTRERASRRSWVLLALVATAMLYTHYLAVLYFAAAGLVVAARLVRSRGLVLRWTAAHVVALVLFLPGVPLLLHNVRADAVRNEQRVRPAPPYVLAPNLALELALGQRTLGFSDPAVRRATLAGAAVVFPLLMAAGAAAGYRERRLVCLLLIAVALFPPALYILSGRRLVAVRFFLPSIVAALVLTAHGLARVPRAVRFAAAAACGLLFAVPLWHFFAKYEWSYDHAIVAHAISVRAQPGDVLLTVHPYEVLYYRHYLGSTLPMAGVTFTPLVDQTTYIIKPEPLNAASVRDRIETVVSNCRRVWVVGQSNRSFASDPRQERELLRWMDSRYGAIGFFDRLTGGDPAIRLFHGGRDAHDATSLACTAREPRAQEDARTAEASPTMIAPACR